MVKYYNISSLLSSPATGRKVTVFNKNVFGVADIHIWYMHGEVWISKFLFAESVPYYGRKTDLVIQNRYCIFLRMLTT